MFLTAHNRTPLNWVVVLTTLVLLGAASHTSAQIQYGVSGLRVGQGNSMTRPASRSFFLALPMYELARGSYAVLVDPCVSISDSRGTIQFIVGIDPKIQIKLPTDSPWLLLETGVGLNMSSFTEIGGRQLGESFLFSPTASLGLRTNNFLTVFYTFKHFSNASLFQHNDGVNYQYIVFSVNFGGL